MDDTRTLSNGSVLNDKVMPVLRETISTTMALRRIKLIFNCIGTINGQSAARMDGLEGRKGEEGVADSMTISPAAV